MCAEVGTFTAQKQNNVSIQTPLSGVTVKSRLIQNSNTVRFHTTKINYYGISLVNYNSTELDLSFLCHTSYVIRTHIPNTSFE